MVLLFRMTVSKSVQFDRESRFFAEKIRDENSDRVLASKFVAAKTPGTEPSPHQFFGPSLRLAQSTGLCGLNHESRFMEKRRK